MSFETLGLGPNILRSIEESGYSEPTPIQSAAIPLILEGNDVIGIAQTGTGKTAAFTLPMLATLAPEELRNIASSLQIVHFQPDDKIIVGASD